MVPGLAPDTPIHRTQQAYNFIQERVNTQSPKKTIKKKKKKIKRRKPVVVNEAGHRRRMSGLKKWLQNAQCSSGLLRLYFGQAKVIVLTQGLGPVWRSPNLIVVLGSPLPFSGRRRRMFSSLSGCFQAIYGLEL